MLANDSATLISLGLGRAPSSNETRPLTRKREGTGCLTVLGGGGDRNILNRWTSARAPANGNAKNTASELENVPWLT